MELDFGEPANVSSSWNVVASGSANTNVVRTDGNYSVDFGRWVNWGTPALQ